MHQSQSQRLGHKTKTLLVAVGFSCISVSSFAATQTCAAYELAKAGADAAYKQEVERINNAAKANPVRLILSDSAWGRYRYHLKSHSFRLSATLLIR